MTAEKRASLAELVSVSDEVLHGDPCFAGTRVPVRTLLNFLEDGETIDAFLDVYPAVERKQVLGFLSSTSQL